jgi:hypothetical protein
MLCFGPWRRGPIGNPVFLTVEGPQGFCGLGAFPHPRPGKSNSGGESRTDRNRVRSGLPQEAPPVCFVRNNRGSLPTALAGRLSVRKAKTGRCPVSESRFPKCPLLKYKIPYPAQVLNPLLEYFIGRVKSVLAGRDSGHRLARIDKATARERPEPMHRLRPEPHSRRGRYPKNRCRCG